LRLSFPESGLAIRACPGALVRDPTVHTVGVDLPIVTLPELTPQEIREIRQTAIYVVGGDFVLVQQQPATALGYRGG